LISDFEVCNNETICNKKFMVNGWQVQVARLVAEAEVVLSEAGAADQDNLADKILFCGGGWNMT
jgi:hypothetical protein